MIIAESLAKLHEVTMTGLVKWFQKSFSIFSYAVGHNTALEAHC